MTDLFYWKELERRARAAQALAMLYNRTDTSGINEATPFSTSCAWIERAPNGCLGVACRRDPTPARSP